MRELKRLRLVIVGVLSAAICVRVGGGTMAEMKIKKERAGGRDSGKGGKGGREDMTTSVIKDDLGAVHDFDVKWSAVDVWTRSASSYDV